MSHQPPPDRRDQLLNDLHEDPASLSLPAQMAARIRRRRRIRTAATSLAVFTVASLILFHTSRPQPGFISEHPQLAQTSPGLPVSSDLTTSPPSPSSSPAATVAKLPPANLATDADLMAALEHESVMIFTLADGQRQVVWLDGRPRS